MQFNFPVIAGIFKTTFFFFFCKVVIFLNFKLVKLHSFPVIFLQIRSVDTGPKDWIHGHQVQYLPFLTLLLACGFTPMLLPRGKEKYCLVRLPVKKMEIFFTCWEKKNHSQDCCCKGWNPGKIYYSGITSNLIFKKVI